MERLPKPYYDIEFDRYAWLLDLPVTRAKKAVKHWEVRFWMLNNYQMEKALLYSYEWDLLTELCTELYERICFIRYPKCRAEPSKYYKWIEGFQQAPERWLSTMPPGSFVAISKGAIIGEMLNVNSPQWIGPELESAIGMEPEAIDLKQHIDLKRLE